MNWIQFKLWSKLDIKVLFQQFIFISFIVVICTNLGTNRYTWMDGFILYNSNYYNFYLESLNKKIQF